MPGEVSETDLRLVVKLVLGKKWAPEDEDEEEEPDGGEDAGEELPDGGEDKDG